MSDSMPPPRRSDQVFQLSLTEISFIVAFVLLLLLGWMVFNLQQKNEKAQEQLELVPSIEAARDAIVKAERAIKEQFEKVGISNPDEVVSALIEATRKEADFIRQQRRIEELEDRLSALTEVQKALDNSLGDKNSAIKKQVHTALAFKQAVEEAAGKKVDDTNATDFGRQVGQLIKEQASKEGEKTKAQLVAENKDLRGQIAHLRRELNSRGGRDYPPCWADEVTGKVQYLFEVTITENGYLFASAWKEERSADAAKLNAAAVLTASPITIGEMRRRVAPIFEASKSAECRHYVRLKVKGRMPDVETYNRHRLAIEDYFYKYEVR